MFHLRVCSQLKGNIWSQIVTFALWCCVFDINVSQKISWVWRKKQGWKKIWSKMKIERYISDHNRKYFDWNSFSMFCIYMFKIIVMQFILMFNAIFKKMGKLAEILILIVLTPCTSWLYWHYDVFGLN